MGSYAQLIPILIVFVVFYFVLLLPEKKRKKKYQEMLQDLKVNDDITTVGGIIGRIISMDDDSVIIESGPDRTKIRFTKSAISKKIYKEN
jgi:preprotein translocase subunit YajC